MNNESFCGPNGKEKKRWLWNIAHSRKRVKDFGGGAGGPSCARRQAILLEKLLKKASALKNVTFYFRALAGPFSSDVSTSVRSETFFRAKKVFFPSKDWKMSSREYPIKWEDVPEEELKRVFREPRRQYIRSVLLVLSPTTTTIGVVLFPTSHYK
jgi:hypothetical protein